LFEDFTKGKKFDYEIGMCAEGNIYELGL